MLYHGLAIMGGGAILGGLVLGAIAAFVIDRAFRKAAAFALAGAVLTFFGFMHGEAIGFGADAARRAQLSRRRAGARRVRKSARPTADRAQAWSSSTASRRTAPPTDA